MFSNKFEQTVVKVYLCKYCIYLCGWCIWRG